MPPEPAGVREPRRSGAGELSLLGLELGDGGPQATSAAQAFARVLRLPSTQAEVEPRVFSGGAHWIELPAGAAAAAPRERPFAPAATLHCGCTDLPARRRQLERWGFEFADSGTREGMGRLRLEPTETGALAIEMHARGASPTPPPAAPAADPRLVQISMRVRAPERMAEHWSRLLQRPAGRAAAGGPCICIDGVTLRFIAAEGASQGLHALGFATGEPEAVCRRAAAHGFDADPAGLGFRVDGLRFALAPG